MLMTIIALGVNESTVFYHTMDAHPCARIDVTLQGFEQLFLGPLVVFPN